MSNTITIEVTRKDGTHEVKDVTAKFGGMTAAIADKIRKANAAVGNIIGKITVTQRYNNLLQLEREYRAGMLEGGEGYVPDMTQDSRYREWVEVVNY